MSYDPTSSLVSSGVGTRDQWIAAITPHGAAAVPAIVDAYIQYGAQVGLNHDLALAQACVECTWFTDYKWVQFFNPAGIGSTSRATQGDVYPSIPAGVTAQYSHQCAYAYTASECPIEQMGADQSALFNDSRHALVGHRGQRAIGYLNGHWAIPGDQYAEDICAVANAVIGSTPTPPLPAPTPAPVPSPTPNPGGNVIDKNGGGIRGLIDIRDQLATNPNGGPRATTWPKAGAIVHYNGPPVTQPGRDQLTGDAVYHCQEDWGGGVRGDGIMYHIGICEDGSKYLLRDLDAVLWHCASWPENGTYVSITCPIGEGQHVTPAQLTALAEVVDDVRAGFGFPLANVKGHQEVSSTSCPGTLMDDFIYPYRAGTLGGTPVSDYILFSETQHGIGGGFRRYFQSNGGVPVFGLPITEEVQAVCEDGVTRTVQYFERNRFEYHPENPAPNDILLTRYGAHAAKEAGYTGPGIN